MKRLWIVLAVLCLLATSVMGAMAVSADAVVYGDVNEDGKVNNRDLGVMQRYLNDLIGEDELNMEAADVTHDGKVNNRDLGLLQQFLNDLVDSLDPEKPEGDDNIFNDTELDWT